MSYITLPNPSAPIIGLDGNSWEASSVFRLKDNVTVHIGNDFSISANLAEPFDDDRSATCRNHY